jgi:hypothetical protein
MIRRLIGVLWIASIVCGARFACARESLRNTDLQDSYQELNVKSFHGGLPRLKVALEF